MMASLLHVQRLTAHGPQLTASGTLPQRHLRTQVQPPHGSRMLQQRAAKNAVAPPPPPPPTPSVDGAGPGPSSLALQAGELGERERLRRERISKANVGKVPWNKGRQHSPGALHGCYYYCSAW